MPLTEEEIKAHERAKAIWVEYFGEHDPLKNYMGSMYYVEMPCWILEQLAQGNEQRVRAWLFVINELGCIRRWESCTDSNIYQEMEDAYERWAAIHYVREQPS
jgi:hypothetical protein